MTEFNQYKFKQGGRGDTGVKGLEGDSTVISIYETETDFGLISRTGLRVRRYPTLSTLNIEDGSGDTVSYRNNELTTINPNTATTSDVGQVKLANGNDIITLNDTKAITPKQVSEQVYNLTTSKLIDYMILNRRNRRGDVNSYTNTVETLLEIVPPETGYTVLIKSISSIAVWNGIDWDIELIDNIQDWDEWYVLQSIDNALIYVDGEWLLSGTIIVQGEGDGTYVSPYKLTLQDKIIKVVAPNWDNSEIQYTPVTKDWTPFNIPSNSELIQFVFKLDNNIIEDPKDLTQNQIDDYLNLGYKLYSRSYDGASNVPAWLTAEWIREALGYTFSGNDERDNMRTEDPVIRYRHNSDYRLDEYDFYWNNDNIEWYGYNITMMSGVYQRYGYEGFNNLPITEPLPNGRYTTQMLADYYELSLPIPIPKYVYTEIPKPVEYVPVGEVAGFNTYKCTIHNSDINYTLTDADGVGIPVTNITLSSFTPLTDRTNSLVFKHSQDNTVVFDLIENINTLDLGHVSFRVTFSFTVRGKSYTHSEIVDLMVLRDDRLEPFSGEIKPVRCSAYTAYRANCEGQVSFVMMRHSDGYGNTFLIGDSLAELDVFGNIELQYKGEWWSFWGLFHTSMSMYKTTTITIPAGTVFRLYGEAYGSPNGYYTFKPSINMGVGAITPVYT